MFIQQNANPNNKLVDDCVIRAISTATDRSWDDIYWDLSVRGAMYKDLLNANYIWWEYLTDIGFKGHRLPDTCPWCYTIRDFCRDHRQGIYVVGDGSHAVAVIDGNYIDTADSGSLRVLLYFERRQE